jgi:hypothetical protein
LDEDPSERAGNLADCAGRTPTGRAQQEEHDSIEPLGDEDPGTPFQLDSDEEANAYSDLRDIVDRALIAARNGQWDKEPITDADRGRMTSPAARRFAAVLLDAVIRPLLASFPLAELAARINLPIATDGSLLENLRQYSEEGESVVTAGLELLAEQLDRMLAPIGDDRTDAGAFLRTDSSPSQVSCPRVS